MGDRRRTRSTGLRRGVATALGGVLLAGLVVAHPVPAAAAGCSGRPNPAPNDSYSASVVFGNTTTPLTTGSNCFSGIETDEPSHAGQAAKASVWFSLQPARHSAGRVFVSTAGSDFDTRLALYDGFVPTVGQLTVIGQNDDVAPPSNKTSRVEVFNPAYRPFAVAVDGYFNGSLTQVGSIILNWGYLLTPFTSVSDMVGDLTQIYLRRTPTSSEISSAQTDYASGHGWSPALLAQRLVNADAGMERSRAVARLYTAVLGRLPDTGGLEYWVAQRASGVSFQEIARQMTGSSEFRTTYGPLTNTQFVNLVYENVLGRQPDTAGRSYWVGQLDAGYARSAMMVGFSESPEFKTGSRRLMDIAVMYRLGHASITSTGIETVAAGSIPITDLWAHMAENAAYRTYVGSL